jgi:anti-sigma B factor antagonist
MGEIPDSARARFRETSENACMKINVPNEVLRVEGFAALTAANSDTVGRKIRADLNGHTTIEIDLSKTTFMDCTGLGALIALRNLARARNGGVRLLNPTPTVQQLFDVVRAGHMFEIVNTRPTDHT